MFPDYPTMICRRCGHSFQITDDIRREAQRMIRFECPSCKYETVGSGMRAFLNFYPRLVKLEEKLNSEGIFLVDYEIGDIMGLGFFSWLKGKIKYKCNHCSNTWATHFDPDTFNYKEKPKSFYCPSCFYMPNPKTTKEFFMSLNQVTEGAFKLRHAQWDIFSILGYEVPVKKIQLRIYSHKFPIT